MALFRFHGDHLSGGDPPAGVIRGTLYGVNAWKKPVEVAFAVDGRVVATATVSGGGIVEVEAPHDETEESAIFRRSVSVWVDGAAAGVPATIFLRRAPLPDGRPDRYWCETEGHWVEEWPCPAHG